MLWCFAFQDNQLRGRCLVAIFWMAEANTTTIPIKPMRRHSSARIADQHQRWAPPPIQATPDVSLIERDETHASIKKTTAKQYYQTTNKNTKSWTPLCSSQRHNHQSHHQPSSSRHPSEYCYRSFGHATGQDDRSHEPTCHPQSRNKFNYVH